MKSETLLSVIKQYKYLGLVLIHDSSKECDTECVSQYICKNDESNKTTNMFESNRHNEACLKSIRISLREFCSMYHVSKK